jgi:outer membrane protein assembly factor BamB
MLAIATTDKRLVLVEPTRGRRQATVTLPDRAAADLVAIGDIVLACCQDGSAVTVNAATGREGWTQRLDRNAAVRACAANQAFVLVGENGNLRALDARTGTAVWTRNLEAQIEGAPACNGRELCLVLTGRVLLLDPATGNVRGQSAEGEAFTGTPVLLKDRIAVPIRDGSWRVLARDTLEVLYQLRASKRLVAAGTAWRETGLLVGTMDRKLVFFRSLP